MRTTLVTCAVRAITIEQQGVFAIFPSLLVDDRYGNLGTVSCSHNTLTRVLSSVVATENFRFFFSSDLFPCCKKTESGVIRDVFKPQGSGVEFWIASFPKRVVGSGKVI